MSRSRGELSHWRFSFDPAQIVAQPGEPAEGGLRIATPGTYTAYCSVAGPRAAGMEMTVTVQEPRRRSVLARAAGAP